METLGPTMPKLYFPDNLEIFGVGDEWIGLICLIKGEI